MKYEKGEFVDDFRWELEIEPYSPIRIARWAGTIYMFSQRKRDDDLDQFILKLMAMEEGHQFEYTKQQLLFEASELVK